MPKHAALADPRLPPPRAVIVAPRRSPDGPPRWLRRLVFWVALLVLVASVPLLARLGYRTAIAAEGKIANAAAQDPSAPGYRAVVTPTPTMLVVHRGPEGQLGSISLLAVAGDSGGGAVLLVPGGVVADLASARPRTLAAIYVDEGVAGVQAAVGRMFRIGFQSVVTADARDWVTAAQSDAPLSLNNPDDVLDANGEIVIGSGPLSLTAAQVEPFLRLRNPGEDERGQLYRAQLLWRAWMDSRRQRPVSGGEVGLAALIADLGRGPVEVLPLPVQVADAATLARVDATAPRATTATVGAEGGGTDTTLERAGNLFVVDLAAVRSLVASLVPFPSSSQPGDRVRVRLLDGLGDAAQAINVSSLLVPAGAEITVFGNADHFEYPSSVVEYYVQAQATNAQALASVLGLASATFNPAGDATVDVSVIVGRDLARQGFPAKVTMPSVVAASGG